MVINPPREDTYPAIIVGRHWIVKTTITNLERSKSVVSIDTFLKIADALGYIITIEDL